MKIKDLFQKDIYRKIQEVIKVDQADQETVRRARGWGQAIVIRYFLFPLFGGGVAPILPPFDDTLAEKGTSYTI